jgi:hypothetical protein
VAGVFLVLETRTLVDPYFVIYCAVLAAAAIAIPVHKLLPDHSWVLLSLSMFARAKGDTWPEFPTRLAGGAVIAASGLILLTVRYIPRRPILDRYNRADGYRNGPFDLGAQRTCTQRS